MVHRPLQQYGQSEAFLDWRRQHHYQWDAYRLSASEMHPSEMPQKEVNMWQRCCLIEKYPLVITNPEIYEKIQKFHKNSSKQDVLNQIYDYSFLFETESKNIVQDNKVALLLTDFLTPYSNVLPITQTLKKSSRIYTNSYSHVCGLDGDVSLTKVKSFLQNISNVL